jgi:hypothetical protein
MQREVPASGRQVHEDDAVRRSDAHGTAVGTPPGDRRREPGLYLLGPFWKRDADRPQKEQEIRAIGASLSEEGETSDNHRVCTLSMYAGPADDGTLRNASRAARVTQLHPNAAMTSPTKAISITEIRPRVNHRRNRPHAFCTAAVVL